MQPAPHQDETTAPIEQLLAQGIEYAEAGDPAAAIPLFQQALEQDPRQGGAWEMLAQCCMDAGQHDMAYGAACKARQLMPASTAALLTLGRAARNAGRLKEAASALEAALGLLEAGADKTDEDGCDTSRAVIGEATFRGGSGKDQAREAQGTEQELQEEIQRELAEVVELKELEVGHAIGLPGLRIREAAAGSQLGPGSVVWDSGVLLAKLLVTRSGSMAGQQGPPQSGLNEAEQRQRLCPLPDADFKATRISTSSCTVTGTGNPQRCGCSQSLSSQAAAAEPAVAPLPGQPTFALPPESGPMDAAPCAAATPAAPGAAEAKFRVGEALRRSLASAAGGASLDSTAQGCSAGCNSRGSGGGRHLMQGARVLELGSGTGVVGLAAACLGAQVLATDLPEVLHLLRANMEANTGMEAAAGGSIVAGPLDWEQSEAGGLQLSAGSSSSSRGVREDPRDAKSGPSCEEGEAPAECLAGAMLTGRDMLRLLEGRPWDWVLGADLVYSLRPVVPLVRTIAALVRESCPRAGLDGPPVAFPSDGGSTAAGPARTGTAADRGLGGCSACKAGRAMGSCSGVKLLLAHKHRHGEVDSALLDGLTAAGVRVRAVARDSSGKVVIYANSAAAAALGL